MVPSSTKPPITISTPTTTTIRSNDTIDMTTSFRPIGELAASLSRKIRPKEYRDSPEFSDSVPT